MLIETNQMSDNGYAYINLEYLELMSDGDADMKKVMLEMLLSELPEELEKMKTLLAEANWDELSSVSHKMKSTLAFVGNKEMTNANKDIEIFAKSAADQGKITPLMEVLNELSPKIMAELKVEESRL